MVPFSESSRGCDPIPNRHVAKQRPCTKNRVWHLQWIDIAQHRSGMRVSHQPLGAVGSVRHSRCTRQATGTASYHSSLRRRRIPPRRETRLVYNIDQVEDCERALGLSFVERESTQGKPRDKDCLGLLRSLEKRSLEVLHDDNSDRAYYSPRRDVIVMPPPEQFGTDGDGGESSYWATLWHEVVHWTGHRTRLNRTRHVYWGDAIYAFEELIAEIGSAFICAHLGVPHKRPSTRVIP